MPIRRPHTLQLLRRDHVQPDRVDQGQSLPFTAARDCLLDMPALSSYTVGMIQKHRPPVQYTLRGVPPAVDDELRKRAAAQGKSLNQVAIEALQQAVGAMKPSAHDALRDLVGTWIEDPQFDRIMNEQDRVDEDLWR